MKWNGIVSQLGTSPIATRFATGKASHASSTPLRRAKPIPAMTHRLDRRLRAELLPQPPHADVNDVRVRFEVIAPDLREQALATDHLARMPHELVQQPELAVGEVGHHLPEPRLAPGQVERQGAGREDVPVAAPVAAPQLR